MKRSHDVNVTGHQPATGANHLVAPAPDPVPQTPRSNHGLEREPLLNRVQAAAYLGVSPQTLAANVTTKRVDLPYVKGFRRVMYRRIDLDAFIAANLHGVTTTHNKEQQ